MSPVYVLSLVLSLQSVRRCFYTLLKHFQLGTVLDAMLPLKFAQKVERLKGDPNENTESWVFLVALLLVSGLAVYYLCRVENYFHEDLVEAGFVLAHREDDQQSRLRRACLSCRGLLASKALGVKIIVSAKSFLIFTKTMIAYAIPVDPDLSLALHNSVMTLVCLLAAVIHQKAYQPRGFWIAGH